MSYSAEASHVRIDFFRPSGKWYTTEEVIWSHYEGLIYDCFASTIQDHFRGMPRLRGMWAVCLEPYHSYAHPVMSLVDELLAWNFDRHTNDLELRT